MRKQAVGPVASTKDYHKPRDYRKSGNFGNPWEQNPEPIATKLGVGNYVGALILTSKYGSNRSTWVGWAYAWNITVYDFSFCFFFRFFTSSAGPHGWPILTIYTSKCAVPRKEVPFGGLNDNPKCSRGEIPPKTQFLGPNRHFKPNFRKLKSQYLRKYKSDRHKILTIASGHPLDFVDGLKIKSNKIQDGGSRHFEKRKIAITRPPFELLSPNLARW